MKDCSARETGRSFIAMKQADPFYKGQRWKAVREKVLRRDGYMCQESKRFGKMRQAETVHHIWPREDFPEIEYAQWNLISLTKAAHDEMHDRQTGALTAKGKALQERTERRQRLLHNPWFEGRA